MPIAAVGARTGDVAVDEDPIRALLSQGDVRGAATAAIRALGPDVLRYLRSVLRDEGDAGDAFSEWAERLWRGLPAFEGRSSLRTWALRLATNVAANVRSAAWRKRARRFETGEASRLAARLSTATAIRVDRQRSALDRLRDALSPEEQTLLALRIDQRLAWNDIAEILAGEGGDGPTPATLMKRFERLKERLAKLASDEGLLP
jgi:RNA polymerase sigma-70 factor (ECF subfamily)